jgi:hypothetical protein
MVRHLLLACLVAMPSALIAADDDLRSGTPKSCYLFSWGKGPDGMAQVPAEFRLTLLTRQMPMVDDRISEPSAEALKWVKRVSAPTIATLASVEGRRILQITYPGPGSFGKELSLIMVAVETARGSEWFSPFFAAQPELFSGQLISGPDIPFGYVATLEYSGTGAFRTHHLFDLRLSHPRLVTSLSAGRIQRPDFPSDASYEEALSIFDREADLMAGILTRTTPKPKAKEEGQK